MNALREDDDPDDQSKAPKAPKKHQKNDKNHDLQPPKENDFSIPYGLTSFNAIEYKKETW